MTRFFRIVPGTLASWFVLTAAAADSASSLAYFEDAHVRVDTIAIERVAKVGSGYTVKAVYAYPKGTAFEGHFVGVFLLKDGSLSEILDMVPAERGLDFFPSIKAASRTRVVIAFESDYGELDKREYKLDLRRHKKLVEAVHLPIKRGSSD